MSHFMKADINLQNFYCSIWFFILNQLKLKGFDFIKTTKKLNIFI